MESAVATIVLAAGGSTRLGSPKQSVMFEGQTLLQRAVSTAIAGDLGPIVVVLGAQSEVMYKQLSGLPIQIVENEDWQLGMGSSLRVGVSTAAKSYPHAGGFLLMLCDQPFLTPAHLRALWEQYRSGAPIVASRYDDEQFGPPALFDRKFLAELNAVPDEKGARPVMMRHKDLMAFVRFNHGSIDIDTPADLDSLKSQESSP